MAIGRRIGQKIFSTLKLFWGNLVLGKSKCGWLKILGLARLMVKNLIMTNPQFWVQPMRDWNHEGISQYKWSTLSWHVKHGCLKPIVSVSTIRFHTSEKWVILLKKQFTLEVLKLMNNWILCFGNFAWSYHHILVGSEMISELSAATLGDQLMAWATSGRGEGRSHGRVRFWSIQCQVVRCVSDGGWWSFEPSDVTNRCHSAGPPRTLPNLEAKKGPLEMGEMERLGNLIYNGIQIWLQHDIGMSSAVA